MPRGQALLEVVIVLAIMALVVPAFFTGLSTVIRGADWVQDRALMFELAQSQLEAIQRQDYHENAQDYSLITVPEGYTIQIAVSPAATYTYAAPKLTPTQETVQRVRVTVTGLHGSLEVSGYKVRQ